MSEILISDDHKEVRFDKYCVNCIHAKLSEIQEPCNECLENPSNEYTDKPVKFEGIQK